MSYAPHRVTVRIRSHNPIVWLDVWPGSCDLCVFPEGSRVDRLDCREMALLHAALGYVLSSGPKLTAEGMAAAVASFGEG